jgi:hypothetical protein
MTHTHSVGLLWKRDQLRTQEFCLGGGGRGSTNSVEDRGQREWGSGGGSPLVSGSAQFAIRFDFVKLSGCRWLSRIYFPRNSEFGSDLSKLRNFEGGLEHPNPPPLGTPLRGIVPGGNPYLPTYISYKRQTSIATRRDVTTLCDKSPQISFKFYH